METDDIAYRQQVPEVFDATYVLVAVEQGLSHRAAGERFGVSAASVSRWWALEREQGAKSRRMLTKDYFYDIPELKVDPELLDLAEHILRTKEAHFDPTKFVDRYEQALLEMLAAKQKGMPATPVKAFAPPQNVVNLFDALRQSLAEETKARPIPASAPKVASKKGKPRVKGQGELLLPISGKKANESVKAEEKKPAQTSATRRKAG